MLSARVEEPVEELYEFEEVERDDSYTMGGLLLASVVAYGVFGQMAAVLASAGLGVPSRWVTVPSRALLLGLALFTLGSLILRPSKFSFNSALIAFFLFWIAYGVRVLTVAATRVDVTVETGRFTLSFIATMAVGGVLIPSLSILVNGCWERAKIIRNLCFGLAIGSGITTILFYGSTFTNFENRMSAGQEVDSGVTTINSLAIGYLGAALLMISSYFLVCLEKKGFWGTAAALAVGGMALFLIVGAASRGPIVCSGATGVFLLVSQVRKFDFKKLMMLCAVVFVSIVGIVTLTQATGSTVLDRLLGIGYSIEHQTEGAARMDLYKMAASQISYSPVFGSSLTLRAEDGTDMYPHNLFLEAMMGVGIVGTLPLLFVLFCAFRSCWYILNHKPELGWVSLFFVLFFMYQQLGGAIYSSGQFWISTAAVISCGEWVRRKVAEEELDGQRAVPEQPEEETL